MIEMSHRYQSVEDISNTLNTKKLRKGKGKILVSDADIETSIINAMNDSSDNLMNKVSNNVDKVIEISTAEEYEMFKKKYSRSVVFYGADWCGACKDIKGLYRRIANRYCKRVVMAYVDIDVSNLDFTHVPVFVALRHGKQIDSVEGADRTGLKELVKKVITAK